MTRSLSLSSSIWSWSGARACLGPSKAIIVSVQSKFEAGFARGVGESANAPVVEVAVAVEDDLADPLGEQQLGDRGADLLGGVQLARLGDLSAHVARQR